MSNKPIQPADKKEESIIITAEISTEIPVSELHQFADGFGAVDPSTPLMSEVGEDLESQIEALDSEAYIFINRLNHVAALMVAETEGIHKPIGVTDNPGTRYAKLLALYENAANLQDIVRQVDAEMTNLPGQIALRNAAKWVEYFAAVFGLELPERMNERCEHCGGNHGGMTINLGGLMGQMGHMMQRMNRPDEDDE